MDPFYVPIHSHLLLTAAAAGDGHSPHSAHKPKLSLDRGMSVREAARAVLSFQFDRVLANEQGARRGDDPKVIHDMRVATRRLRAALRVFRQALEQQHYDRLVQEVRWLGKLLGNVRDLDVFIEWLEEYEEAAPVSERASVRRLIAEREAARGPEREALIAGLDSPRYEALKRRFAVLVVEGAGFSPDDQGALGDLARFKIKRQLGKVRKKGKKADLDHLKRLHKLRIQCKRLRYTAEFFETLYDDFPKELTSKPQNIQDSLGAVHDSDVHGQFLQEMRRQSQDDPAMRKAIVKMMRALDRKQRVGYKEFKQPYKKLTSQKLKRRIAR